MIRGHAGTEDDKVEPIQFKVEARRWIIIWVFGLFSATNAMAWLLYAPIMKQAAIYYDVSSTDIIQFSNVYMIAYLCFSFISSWLLYRYFRFSMWTAMILQTCGGWIRYAAGPNYALALFGQILCAIAQNFDLPSPVCIAETWFPASQKNIAVVIGTFMNYLGYGFGFIFPTLFISGDVLEDITTNLEMVMLIEAAILTTPLLPTLLFFKDKPETPPSMAAAFKAENTENFFLSFLHLIKMKKVMFSLISFSICIGISYTSLVLVQDLLPSSYSNTKIGLVGLVFIVVGVIGGLAGTLYTEKKHDQGNFDPIIKAFIFLAMISLVLLAVFMQDDIDPLIFTLSAASGFGLIAFTPFAAQSLSESSFPLKETLVVNFMLYLAQIVGLIGNTITSASFVGKQGMWVLVIMIVPCEIYILFFFKTEFRRMKLEKSHEGNEFAAQYTEKQRLKSEISLAANKTKSSLSASSFAAPLKAIQSVPNLSVFAAPPPVTLTANLAIEQWKSKKEILNPKHINVELEMNHLAANEMKGYKALDSPTKSNNSAVEPVVDKSEAIEKSIRNENTPRINTESLMIQESPAANEGSSGGDSELTALAIIQDDEDNKIQIVRS